MGALALLFVKVAVPRRLRVTFVIYNSACCFFPFFFAYRTAARSYSTAAVSGSAGRVFVETQCHTHKSFFK